LNCFETSLIQTICETLEYSKEHEYRGYAKADGLNSKFLQNLPIDNKWINLIFQESVKRAPINLRPFLGIEKRRVPKGIALFSLSNLNTFELTKKEKYLLESKKLVDWLIKNQPKGYPGFCLTRAHKKQGLNKIIKPTIPNIVSTSYGVKALLELNKYFPGEQYQNIARTSSKFVFNSLDYDENDEAFEKENSWIVGDTEADIMAGEILDIKTIGVLSGERNRMKIKQLGPDHIIEDITELPELLFFENV